MGVWHLPGYWKGLSLQSPMHWCTWWCVHFRRRERTMFPTQKGTGHEEHAPPPTWASEGSCLDRLCVYACMHISMYNCVLCMHACMYENVSVNEYSSFLREWFLVLYHHGQKKFSVCFNFLQSSKTCFVICIWSIVEVDRFVLEKNASSAADGRNVMHTSGRCLHFEWICLL